MSALVPGAKPSDPAADDPPSLWGCDVLVRGEPGLVVSCFDACGALVTPNSADRAALCIFVGVGLKRTSLVTELQVSLYAPRGSAQCNGPLMPTQPAAVVRRVRAGNAISPPAGCVAYAHWAPVKKAQVARR